MFEGRKKFEVSVVITGGPTPPPLQDLTTKNARLLIIKGFAHRSLSDRTWAAK